MSGNFCTPMERKWDAGEISKPFYFSKSNPLFLSFPLEHNSTIVITVSPCNSSFLATAILGADIINLFLVHLRMHWETLQVSSSADTFVPWGGFIHCYKSLTLNILINMFQEGLNKWCLEAVVNNSSFRRKQTLFEREFTLMYNSDRTDKMDRDPLDT